MLSAFPLFLCSRITGGGAFHAVPDVPRRQAAHLETAKIRIAVQHKRILHAIYVLCLASFQRCAGEAAEEHRDGRNLT